jgi:type IV secretory pathway VirJ component
MNVEIVGSTHRPRARTKSWLLALAWLAVATPAAALDGGRLGEVSVANPPGPPRGLTFLFSDAGGWKPADEARLKAVAATGAIAVGVDTDAYLARVEAGAETCLLLFDDADALSRQLQRETADSDYFAPILAGVGKGAALAAAIVTQGRDGMFAGAISLEPSDTLKPTKPFCAREPEPADAYAPPTPGAPAPRQFWTIVLPREAAPEDRARYAAIAERASNVRISEADSPEAPAFLASLIAPRLPRAAADRVGELPLVELRVDHPSRAMAIFVSGDAGWREVDSVISDKLRSLGLPVVGWDSLRYFWRKKTPDEFADDLAAVIAAYRAKWGVDEVALVGFSFGADVLPFAFDRLPEAARRHVRLISLLSLGEAADWEIRVSGWLFSGASTQATPIAPALRQIPSQLIQCIYGNKDPDALCPTLKGSAAEVIEKDGTHHFDGDYDHIATEIFDGLARRSQAAR